LGGFPKKADTVKCFVGMAGKELFKNGPLIKSIKDKGVSHRTGERERAGSVESGR
jgi:hypothetical protein